MTIRATAWAAWALASFFYAYQYVLRVAPNVLKDDILTVFNIDDRFFGQYAGIYYIGYALIHIPLGLLLDRYGPKRVLPIFLGITILGLAPLAFTDYWPFLILGRLVVGIGSASAILGVFKIIRMIFNESQFSLMLSISVTIGLFGAMFGGAPLQALHSSMGLQSIVLMLMAGGILLAVLLFAVTPDAPVSAHRRGDIWGEVRAVLGNRYVLLVCLLSGLLVGPLEGFADAWSKSFLKSDYGFSDSAAASLSMFVFFGMCFGGPFLSFVTKYIRNDLAIIFICGVVMLLAFVCILSGILPASTIAFGILFFIVGIMCAYQILSIAHVSVRVPPQYAGLTSAIANMLIMAFGYLFHTIIGYVLYLQSGVDDTNAVYSERAMFYAIGIIPLALFVGCLGFAILAFRRK